MYIKDIKGPVSLGFNWWGIGIAVLVLLLVAVLVYFLLRYKRKEKKSLEPQGEDLSPYEAARRALDSLRGRGFGPIGRIGEYYTELSDIVRHYLEGRFALNAPEMTTEEFLTVARNRKELTSAHKEALRDFLNHSDMVKFARHEPGRDEIEKSLDLADRFVEETKPAEVKNAVA